MNRSLLWKAALLPIALWMCCVSATAHTRGSPHSDPALFARSDAVASALNLSHASVLWVGTTNGGDDNDKKYGSGNNDGDDHDHDHDHDHDRDHDHDHDHDDHAPTPEPSTILSFGAALLIGGGVLYSRRLRNKKN
jgi:hypothetical protein